MSDTYPLPSGEWSVSPVEQGDNGMACFEVRLSHDKDACGVFARKTTVTFLDKSDAEMARSVFEEVVAKFSDAVAYTADPANKSRLVKAK